jgi:hypothetical protein
MGRKRFEGKQSWSLLGVEPTNQVDIRMKYHPNTSLQRSWKSLRKITGREDKIGCSAWHSITDKTKGYCKNSKASKLNRSMVLWFIIYTAYAHDKVCVITNKNKKNITAIF